MDYQYVSNPYRLLLCREKVVKNTHWGVFPIQNTIVFCANCPRKVLPAPCHIRYVIFRPFSDIFFPLRGASSRKLCGPNSAKILAQFLV
ncbi:hypothetical protein GDO78_009481 [Eleutherodactylus coqui]|uniref:Uncharacterized protein n=1 Tax=Eleutherodactylus coqui TaxID=57060 RepID=A0A8J6F9Z7_ELECQ|nr:hypothetical protein GDO78_009481 [Eleutherodactylus coqui]